MMVMYKSTHSLCLRDLASWQPQEVSKALNNFLSTRCVAPLKANKPVLADAIWSMTKESQTANDPGGSAYFVIDGGALLRRVVWPHGVTHNAICLLYIQYMRRRYPTATIVFDAYDNGPTAKDCTHQRRGHGCGPAVLFDPDMLVTLKKDEFLSNQVNKQKFINLLSENLEHAGYSTRHTRRC